MPTCNKCGTEISQDRHEKFYGLCPICYIPTIGVKKLQYSIDKIIIRLKPIFVIIAITGPVLLIIGMLNISSQLGITFLVIGLLMFGLGIGFARRKDCWCGRCPC